MTWLCSACHAELPVEDAALKLYGSPAIARGFRMSGGLVDVVVELGDPVVLTVTDVHPVALPDAIELAVAAALRLQRELAKFDGEQP